AGDLGLEGRPAGAGVDGQAAIDPAREHGAALELRPKARRDREPSLLVHRVPVLAGEHCPPCLTNFDRLAGTASRSSVSRVPECTSGRPLAVRRELETQGTRGGSPPFPTSHHLQGILGRRGGSSSPEISGSGSRCARASGGN